MIITILKTLAAFVILMLIGTNLIGIIVRSFIVSFSLGTSDNSIVDNQIRKTKTTQILFLILFLIIMVVYFFTVNYFFNYVLMIAAIMIMLSRLPDLILEIKIGRKPQRKEFSNRPINIIFNAMLWLSIPLIWYSFYLDLN